MRFELSIHAGEYSEMVPYLRRHLRAAHSLLRSSLNEVSLALVNDAVMSRLHRRHLGISGPTDVLTFEMEQDSRGNCIGGEVIVCVPQARRQAAGDARREVLLCALHGMLHLCGYDDAKARDYAIMHKMEDNILKRIGVGPVFAPASRNGNHGRDRRPVKPIIQTR